MSSLFVFHRTLGSNDEDATAQERCEKVLYFHTSRGVSDPELQMSEVEVVEALIEMCKTFGATEPCELVSTSSKTYALLECEPDIWMVLSVPTVVTHAPGKSRNSTFKIPLIRSSNRGDSSPTRSQTSEGNMNSFVMRRWMQTMHESFTFLHGTITSLLAVDGVAWEIKRLRKVLRKARKFQRDMDEGDLVPDASQEEVMANREENEDRLGLILAKSPADSVRKRMSRFFPQAMTCVNLSNLHLFYGIGGLYYFAVDKATYLSIQYFMRLLAMGFPPVLHTLLLFNGQLLWTSLSQQHTKTVFNFIRIFLSSETELKASPGYLHMGDDFDNSTTEQATPWDSTDAYAPRCYLNEPVDESTPLRTHRVLAYQLNRTTLVSITDDVGKEDAWTEQDLLTFCGDLEGFAAVELDRLATALTKSAAVTAGETVMGSPSSHGAAHLQGMPAEKTELSFSKNSPGLPRAVQAGPFQGQVNGTALRKARFLVFDNSSLITEASQCLMFPAVLFPKHQHEQLIDQLKLLHVYQSNNIVLGPREIGQGLSVGASKGMNEIYEKFSMSRDESMEFVTSIAASIIPFLKGRSLLPRHTRGGKGSTLANFVDPGCWLCALKFGNFIMFFLLDSRLNFLEASAEFRRLKGTILRDVHF